MFPFGLPSKVVLESAPAAPIAVVVAPITLGASVARVLAYPVFFAALLRSGASWGLEAVWVVDAKVGGLESASAAT